MKYENKCLLIRNNYSIEPNMHQSELSNKTKEKMLVRIKYANEPNRVKYDNSTKAYQFEMRKN